ncbi:hypothetical protein ONZ45_g10023 [Pleurotus djamor]|nr:hypothetical protein ONZ45_g10023 [Pleurotus djamor]
MSSSETVSNDTARLGKRRRLDDDSDLDQTPSLIASSPQPSSSTPVAPQTVTKSDISSLLYKLAETLDNIPEESFRSRARQTPATFKLTHTISLTLASSNENESMKSSLEPLYAELFALSTKARCTDKNAPFWIRPIFKRIEDLLPPNQVLFISPDDVGGPKGNFTDWRMIIAPQSSMNPMNLNGLIVEPDGEEASQATNFYFMDASRSTENGTLAIDNINIIDVALRNMHHLAVKCNKPVIRGVITNGTDYSFLMLQIPGPSTVSPTCTYAVSVSIAMQWDENSILHKLTVDVISSAVAQWAMESNNPEIDERWFKLKPFPPAPTVCPKLIYSSPCGA